MEGIPEDILQQHNQRVSQEFFAAEAERRAVTGNPSAGPGVPNAPAANGGTKRPKFESPAEMKKRLAEHRAQKAAGDTGAVSSDPNTPVVRPLRRIHCLRIVLTFSQVQTATPPVFHQPFPVPQASPPQATFPLPYGQPPPPFHGQQQSPPYNGYGEGYGGPPPAQQGPYPGQFGAPQPQYSPAQHYGDPNQSAGYPPAPHAPFNHFPQNHHPPAPSPSPYNQQVQRPPVHEPPARQNTLPPAPGLPQRPSFDAPRFSREQLAEMHSGNMTAANDTQGQQQHHHHQPHEPSANASSVDDLITSAAQQSVQTPAVITPVAEKPAEKPSDANVKKAKKASRLSYSGSNPDVGIEEKVTSLPKYSYTPEKGEETYLAPVDAAVTGVVQGPDDVIDRQG